MSGYVFCIILYVHTETRRKMRQGVNRMINLYRPYSRGGLGLLCGVFHSTAGCRFMVAGHTIRTYS